MDTRVEVDGAGVSAVVQEAMRSRGPIRRLYRRVVQDVVVGIAPDGAPTTAPPPPPPPPQEAGAPQGPAPSGGACLGGSERGEAPVLTAAM